jgi:hypothetical protein
MTTSGPKTLAATKQFIVVRERVHYAAAAARIQNEVFHWKLYQ